MAGPGAQLPSDRTRSAPAAGVAARPAFRAAVSAATRAAAIAVFAAGLLSGFDCGWRPRGGGDGEPRPADLKDIGVLSDAFLDAYDEGDAERLAALFTDDAVLLPSGSATVEGRDQIADYFDDLLKDEPATPEFEVQETKVLDGWAFERIDVTLSWTDPETGEEVEDWARYFWVLRRQADGTWKIARLIVNTEEPEDTEDEESGDGRRT